MKHYLAVTLLLLLDPGYANHAPRALQSNGGKSGKTVKSVKSTKSGKITKSGKDQHPSCDENADLVARYGTQLCPDEVAARFDRVDGAGIQTDGLPHFLQPTYSAPVSDAFATGGQVALTFEQAVSVCVTKCENDPGCDAVYVRETTVASVVPNTGKPDYQCLMVNSDLGPGAYLSYYPNGLPCSCTTQAATFIKKAGTALPAFEDVQCNVDSSTEAMQSAVGCAVGAVTDPEICGPLLTDDFMEFVRPGIMCVAQNGGGQAVEACFGCIVSSGDAIASDICPVDAVDTTPLFRNPQRCGSVCLGETCAALLETALLCNSGAAVTFGPDGYSGGLINGPDFQCPMVE